jgi:hypothetical protein
MGEVPRIGPLPVSGNWTFPVHILPLISKMDLRETLGRFRRGVLEESLPRFQLIVAGRALRFLWGRGRSESGSEFPGKAFA